MAVESQSQSHPRSGVRSLPPLTPQGPTPTDIQDAPVWLGHDEVVQLRNWASDVVHALPAVDIAEFVIGSGSSSALQLIDPSGFVSRTHARLVRAGSFWQIEDIGSKNGLRKDGASRHRFPLTPGLEVGIGGLTLVAENQTLIQLRGYLARVLGWDAASRLPVDLALRAIRAAATKRVPLVIAGADDLVAVARQIHLRTRPPGAPFIVCGPRHESDSSLRVTAATADAMAAYELADGGTVCVRADEPPAGLDQLDTVSRDPRAHAQLIVCANKTTQRTNATAPSIVVPRLTQRPASDVQRIVHEYATDCIHALGAAPTSFTEANLDWVVRQAATSFAEIEIATLRIVALNDAGNVHRAAARLGLSHVALGNWFKLRGIKPTRL